MEWAAALALFIGVYDVSSYSAIQDRMRFPDDYMLRQWLRNNDAYRMECRRQQESLCLSCSRPRDREFAWGWYAEEIEECDRIRSAIWQLADINFNNPPMPYNEAVLRSWIREARRYMTEEEYIAGYIPFGGVSQQGWRNRKGTGK